MTCACGACVDCSQTARLRAAYRVSADAPCGCRRVGDATRLCAYHEGAEDADARATINPGYDPVVDRDRWMAARVLLDECAVALQLCAPLECATDTDDADCGCVYCRVNPVRIRLREWRCVGGLPGKATPCPKSSSPDTPNKRR